MAMSPVRTPWRKSDSDTSFPEQTQELTIAAMLHPFQSRAQALPVRMEPHREIACDPSVGFFCVPVCKSPSSGVSFLILSPFADNSRILREPCYHSEDILRFPSRWFTILGRADADENPDSCWSLKCCRSAGKALHKAPESHLMTVEIQTEDSVRHSLAIVLPYMVYQVEEGVEI